MAAFTTVDDPGSYFNTVPWTGADNTVERVITGVGFQPDLCWYHGRNVAYNSALWDSVRGAGNDKDIMSNLTGIEGSGDWHEYGYLGSFDTDGFTGAVGSIANGYFNRSTYTYVMWNWKESATSGFDIVSYTGDGSARTISHALSAVPGLIIIKNLDAADAWQIYHGANTTAPETEYLVLNTNAATVDAADRWNDTAPTSSVFSLGDAVEVNTNTENYIAYVFAPKQGYSKFGTYEGNGNADGTFVYTGFRPAYVMAKASSTTGNWYVFDNKREGQNAPSTYGNNIVYANATTIESTDNLIDIFSNGFKGSTAGDPNTSNTYIYAAFAESPFVNSNGVPTNAR